MKLRKLCLESDRLNEVDYASFKKEIGAIEIHKMEPYFFDMLNFKTKVTNKSNSIVAYLVGITDEKPTEPLKYKGGTMPDIDTDIAKDRREEVIEYLRNKYGSNRVTNIGTYGVMHAKLAIRQVGKALGMSSDKVDYIARLIPDPKQGVNWSVDEAIQEVKELAILETSDPEVVNLFKYARKLYGTYNNRSQHAAGIIISNQKIDDIAPTYMKKNSRILEFDMNESEQLGLIKMDLLGLKTLSVIDMAFKLVNERHKTNYNSLNVDFSDPDIYKLLATGNLLGIFQLEGKDISSYTRDFKPKNFMDVAFILAGYRPGPMAFAMSIKDKKNGRTSIEIEPHSERFPILKDILAETYGYFIFQEQIQKTVQLLAGYNDSEADEFRKMVAKKQREKIEKEKKRFTSKALEKGLTQEDIDHLWEEMEKFSNYAFNKAHAVSYAKNTMVTAWLKAHYPTEFYVANIAYELGDIHKFTEFIYEAKLFSIDILSPDVNESNGIFTIVNDKKIRFGLAGIVNVGESAAEPIIEERNKNGAYKSVTDFLYRTNTKSNIVLNMIKAGCFDSFAKRSQLMHILREGKDEPLMYIDELTEMVKRFINKGYIPLPFDEEWIQLPFEPEYPEIKLIALEKEVTELWLTSNPFIIYQEAISNYKKENPTARVDFLKGYSIFKKKKNGCFISFENDPDTTYQIFSDVWSRIGKSGMDKLVGTIVCVNTRILEENRYKVTSIASFENEITSFSSPLVATIPMNNYGLKFLNTLHNKYTDLTVNKKSHHLILDMQGQNTRFQCCPGFTDLYF